MDKFGLHRFAALMAALALLLSACALAEADEDAAEAAYVENAWNFVEGSMDASAGIPDDAEGALARIRESGVLRVATDPHRKPQAFIEANQAGEDSYIGADMEFARLIAERMGVELRILPMNSSDVLESLQDDKADLAISSLAYTPGRASQATLSKGYYFGGEDAGVGLVVREQNLDIIKGIKDLEGRNIVAQSGSAQELLMAENVHQYREFRRLSTLEKVYQAVVLGKADAAAVNIESARRYINDNPDYGLALVEGVCFTIEAQFQGDRVAAKKGETQLVYFVNGIIDELLASGQYQAWYDAYRDYATGARH